MIRNRETNQAAEPERIYDRVCPLCGTVNRRLYLQETKGLYECERCGSIIRTTYPGLSQRVFSVKPYDTRRISCD